MKMLEKDPKLRANKKRTITEELTKGSINPDQFNKYNQEIERVQIEKEVPAAMSFVKVPNLFNGVVVSVDKSRLYLRHRIKSGVNHRNVILLPSSVLINVIPLETNHV